MIIEEELKVMESESSEDEWDLLEVAQEGPVRFNYPTDRSCIESKALMN